MIGDNLLKSNRELHSPHSLFGVMSSGISGHLGADDYDSMYESRSALTTVQKQHFVEWFSGSLLPSYWDYGYSGGSNTSEMNDAVDGGYKHGCGSGVNYIQWINFNGKQQYNPAGSVCISIHRMDSVAQRGAALVGLMNGNSNATSNPHDAITSHHAGFLKQHENNIYASSSNGTCTSTDTTVGGDAYKTYKSELGSSNIKFYIDGSLEITKTTNLPTNRLQPSLTGYHKGGQGNLLITYMECYNT